MTAYRFVLDRDWYVVSASSLAEAKERAAKKWPNLALAWGRWSVFNGKSWSETAS